MDDLARLRIERACEALSIAFARSIDFNDQDHFVDLWAPGAVLELDGRHEGEAAIARWIAGRPRRLRTRHLLTNHHVEVLAPERARGVVYLTRWSAESDGPGGPSVLPTQGPDAVGHCQDRYVLTSAGWRFETRVVHWAMYRA